MKIVLSLGGSVIGENPSPQRLKDLAAALETLRNAGDEVHVVVGGGPLKNQFGEIARSAGLSEYTADVLGIQLTRIYARLIAGVIGDGASGFIPESVEEAVRARSGGKTVVMGGTEAGHSTTAVAALFAEAIGAPLLLKLTDVNGVYSQNPKKFPNAILYDEVTYGELTQILGTPEFAAGTYDVLDSVALGVLGRSSIDTVYFEGASTMGNIVRARSHSLGTLITSDARANAMRKILEDVLRSLGLSVTSGTPTERGALPTRCVVGSTTGFRVSVTYRLSSWTGTSAVEDAVRAAALAKADIPVLVAGGFSPGAVDLAQKKEVRRFSLGHYEALRQHGSKTRPATGPSSWTELFSAVD